LALPIPKIDLFTQFRLSSQLAPGKQPDQHAASELMLIKNYAWFTQAAIEFRCILIQSPNALKHRLIIRIAPVDAMLAKYFEDRFQGVETVEGQIFQSLIDQMSASQCARVIGYFRMRDRRFFHVEQCGDALTQRQAD